MKAFDPAINAEREVTENDVVVNGRIIGTDPDPNIRAALLRENQEGPGGTGGSDAT